VARPRAAALLVKRTGLRDAEPVSVYGTGIVEEQIDSAWAQPITPGKLPGKLKVLLAELSERG